MSKAELIGKLKASMEENLTGAKSEVAKIEENLESINALGVELEKEDAANKTALEAAKEEGRQQGISEAGAGDMLEAMKPLNEKIAALESEKATLQAETDAKIADLTAQNENLQAKVTELEAKTGYSEDEVNVKVQDAVMATRKEIAARIKDANVDDMALADELANG